MHHKFDNMGPTTDFGKWLYTKMKERDMTCNDVANRLHTTRQTIAFHINGRPNPSYPFVVAYCWMFGDNPDNIWELVEHDKAQ